MNLVIKGAIVRFFCLAVFPLAFSIIAEPAAAASSFTKVYTFCQQASCTDGMNPYTAPPFVTASGDIFGTAEKGGDATGGVIYRLAKSGDSYTYSRVYTFCHDAPTCTDGGYPVGHLIQDKDGNFYGVTAYNSKVYELVANAGRTAWTYKVVFSFGAGGVLTKGWQTTAGLTYKGAAEGELYDGKSTLYGTTTSGGAANQGVVYQLTPHAGGWTQDVLYDFCSKADCADGKSPGHVALLMDKTGKTLTGTTIFGGANAGGVVFQLKGGKKGWKQTVLYDFCSKAPSCADGEHPDSALVADGDGAFYGTTISTAVDGGIVYKLVPGKKPKYTVLYHYCQTDCADGDQPYAPLAMDALGNLYAVAMDQGVGGGTLMLLARKGKKFKPSLLHTFCSETGCADGQHPFAPVVFDASGNLYGTTNMGGNSGNGGIVFKLKP
jgi:uncharacterized repeat protein (TIGR03803 family)